MAQLVAKGREFDDARVEIGGPPLDEFEHVVTWGPPGFPEGDDAPDLAKGQPHGLGCPDETQPVEERLGVVPVATGGAVWLW